MRRRFPIWDCSEDKNIIWKYNVPEEQECYEAAVDLVASGCDLVISNSYGHQTFMVQAAAEYPDVQFVSMTGDFAAILRPGQYEECVYQYL